MNGNSSFATRHIPRTADALECIAALSNDEVPTPKHLANQMLDLLPPEIFENPDTTILDPGCKTGVFLREAARRLMWGVPDIRTALPDGTLPDDPEGRTPTKGLTQSIPLDAPAEIPCRREIDLGNCTHSESERDTCSCLDKGTGQPIGELVYEPNAKTRREHVYRRMLWGLAITGLTAEISRRTLYYTAEPNDPNFSVVPMNHAEGNIRFVPAQHTFKKTGGCEICGAPRDLERGAVRENYAYSFIHPESAFGSTAEGEARSMPEDFPMHFDVIIGNPPYQMEVEGNGRTRPLYPAFVEAALEMAPRHLLMITPSRWFAGGTNLRAMRDRLLRDRRMASIVDFPRTYDCFADVKIRGGVSYFHWSSDHDGLCRVETRWSGEQIGSCEDRALDEFDIFVRRNESVAVVRKVLAAEDAFLDHHVSSFNPFGYQTNEHGVSSPLGLVDPIQFYGSKRTSWIERSAVRQLVEAVDRHKVLLHRAYGEDGDGPFRVIASPSIADPGSACSGTYLVIRCFDEPGQATRFDGYMRTRFFRFMVMQRMMTQDLKSSTFRFVPDLPMDRDWHDLCADRCNGCLYVRYGLTDEEVAFIEAQVKEMPPATQGTVTQPAGATPTDEMQSGQAVA